MGTPSSARIIKDIDLSLKALKIVFRENGYSVEYIDDINGHRKKVVGEGKSVSWRGSQTKGEGRECKLTKNMFLHSDLLKLCLKKNTPSLSSYLTQPCFTIRKLALQVNVVKI